jgi:hypothetical protein
MRNIAPSLIPRLYSLTARKERRHHHGLRYGCGSAFYDLFKPVDKTLSLHAAIFRLMLLTGYLIFRSNFLPRIIGILLALAGLGYLTFWPVIIGVNAERWTQQASAAGRA